MDYSQALEYIHSVASLGSRPGLERITELMRLLGDPQDKLKYVHVAGTNGKGSFCAMLESVLRAAGYKTGLFTSPHIIDINERIMINGCNIDNDAFCDAAQKVKSCADKMADRPTEFEILTAMAFCAFADAGCDIVVLECGMGGRLDATNIIKNKLLAVITGVSLDHTHILGDTLQAIAAEKSGIIMQGVPVLYGGNSKTAFEVISSVAAEKNSKLAVTDKKALCDCRYDIHQTRFTYKNKQYGISLAGAYQPANAANVIEAAGALKNVGVDIPDVALEYGLSHTSWRARFEILQKDPIVVYDGGHNPEGAQAVADSVEHYFGGKCVLITGVLADKDCLGIAMNLADVAVRAYTVTPPSTRALDAEHWADDLRMYGVPSIACKDFFEAIKKSFDFAAKNSLPVVVTGSLYMYNDFKAAFLST